MIKKIFLFIFAINFLFINVAFVSAANTLQESIDAQNQAFAGKSGANVGTAKDIRIVVADIIQIFLGFLGVLATTYLVYGGYMYMTAAGNEQRSSNASKIILYSALGLFVILGSYSITRFVYKTFQKGANTTYVDGNVIPNEDFVPR